MKRGDRVLATVHGGGSVEVFVWDVKDGIALVTDKKGLSDLYANRRGARKIGFKVDDLFHVEQKVAENIEK